MNKIQTLQIRPVGNPKAPTWVFDDARFGLVAEPFVANAEHSISKMALSLGKDISKPLTLIFSDEWFPESIFTFKKLNTKLPSGTDYFCEQTKEKAWLCNCLFYYYPVAPKMLYATVKQ